MSLLMGKVCEAVGKNIVRVAIPQLKFDSFLVTHFRDSSELHALDKKGESKVGDWVIVSKLPERISLKVEHSVEQVVYKCGHIIDPLTGKRCFQYHYDESGSKENQNSSPNEKL
ncbi:28S ribosomal protein S17, mitochondrial-like [Panonychus citri]|uniref:28S ribosomal protein S17, mitochondrial-like n=1 Tax=Panonychus citri TaxID=50023 RepID=UPI002307108F|nr:28S ribosomal protein S17, mitochondrial-like [Panonychus citri]XP_053203293.1 28S ribosomal protein S17, mitochondrial-like [Panonychus citri]